MNWKEKFDYWNGTFNENEKYIKKSLVKLEKIYEKNMTSDEFLKSCDEIINLWDEVINSFVKLLNISNEQIKSWAEVMNSST